MSLAARLAAVRGEDFPVAAHGQSRYPAGVLDEVPPGVLDQPPGDVANERPAAPSPHTAEALLELRTKVRAQVITRLGADLQEGRLDEDDLRRRAAAVIEEELTMLALPADQRALVAQQVLDDTLGLGPLEPLLRDSGVDEIMVNGAGTVYIERDGLVQPSPARFTDEEHLRRTIDRIVARVGRRIDEASPMVDARLLDGSRVNAVVPPIAIDGTTLTIRKFNRRALSMDDLIGLGCLGREAAGLLAMCVVGRLNILVSGGTGSGKTTPYYWVHENSGGIRKDQRRARWRHRRSRSTSEGLPGTRR